MSHLEWVEIPKQQRLTKGIKHAFFTNKECNEIIIPCLRGVNVMTLKSYEKRFAYGSSHVTSVLIRNCRDWNVPAQSVVGNTVQEGAQEALYLYTHLGNTRVNTLLRGGIMFINGGFFDKAYFVCPTLESYYATLTWLKELGKLLKPL